MPGDDSTDGAGSTEGTGDKQRKEWSRAEATVILWQAEAAERRGMHSGPTLKIHRHTPESAIAMLRNRPSP